MQQPSTDVLVPGISAAAVTGVPTSSLAVSILGPDQEIASIRMNGGDVETDASGVSYYTVPPKDYKFNESLYPEELLPHVKWLHYGRAVVNKKGGKGMPQSTHKENGRKPTIQWCRWDEPPLYSRFGLSEGKGSDEEEGKKKDKNDSMNIDFDLKVDSHKNLTQAVDVRNREVGKKKSTELFGAGTLDVVVDALYRPWCNVKVDDKGKPKGYPDTCRGKVLLTDLIDPADGRVISKHTEVYRLRSKKQVKDEFGNTKWEIECSLADWTILRTRKDESLHFYGVGMLTGLWTVAKWGQKHKWSKIYYVETISSPTYMRDASMKLVEDVPQSDEQRADGSASETSPPTSGMLTLPAPAPEADADNPFAAYANPTTPSLMSIDHFSNLSNSYL